MAESLTRRDGRPVNIRKVNGRWMFDKGLFGSAIGTLPPELLLVPQDMIPELVYSDNSTGYIPESQITAYLASQRFRSVINQAAPAYAEAQKRAQQGLPTNMVRTETKLSQDALLRSVNNVVKGLNETQRSNAFASVTKKTRTKDEQVVTFKSQGEAFAGTFPGDSSDPWAFTKRIVNAALTNELVGKYRYGVNLSTGFLQRNTEPILLLPDDTGKVVEPFTASGYSNLFWTMPKAEVKRWEKFLGVEQTGNMTNELAGKLLGVANSVSMLNYNAAARGETKNKPYSLWDGANFLKKSGSLGDLGGGGGTSVSRNIASFDEADAEAILNEFYTASVGRRANKQEIKKFNDLINQRAKARPTVSTTTVSGTTSTTTQKAGFTAGDAAALAEKQARTTPGAVGFTTATRYMDVINKLIQNPLG